jgi:hypothetical protein
VRCKSCHYSLENLTEHRCPECGTPFDPTDPDTLSQRWTATDKLLFCLKLMWILGLVAAIGLLAWYFSGGGGWYLDAW